MFPEAQRQYNSKTLIEKKRSVVTAKTIKPAEDKGGLVDFKPANLGKGFSYDDDSIDDFLNSDEEKDSFFAEFQEFRGSLQH
ncbi:zinc finger HIT domain-containing protein 3 [Prionailurus iriomotensis]